MQSVIHKNDNSACLCSLIMSPDLYFSSVWFPEYNSTTVRNDLIVLSRIIKCKNENSANLGLLSKD